MVTPLITLLTHFSLCLACSYCDKQSALLLLLQRAKLCSADTPNSFSGEKATEQLVWGWAVPEESQRGLKDECRTRIDLVSLVWVVMVSLVLGGSGCHSGALSCWGLIWMHFKSGRCHLEWVVMFCMERSRFLSESTQSSSHSRGPGSCRQLPRLHSPCCICTMLAAKGQAAGSALSRFLIRQSYFCWKLVTWSRYLRIPSDKGA